MKNGSTAHASLQCMPLSRARLRPKNMVSIDTRFGRAILALRCTCGTAFEELRNSQLWMCFDESRYATRRPATRNLRLVHRGLRHCRRERGEGANRATGQFFPIISVLPNAL